jgi:hypothetical protein
MAYTITRSAITTYLGPDHRGARVKATHCTTHQSMILPWDFSVDCGTNHERAARAVLGLGVRQPYSGKLLGCSVDRGGYVFTVAFR